MRLKRKDGLPRLLEEVNGVGLWKEISKEAPQPKYNSLFVIGDGSIVKIWEDMWCSMDPLRVSLPSLNALANPKGGRRVAGEPLICEALQ